MNNYVIFTDSTVDLTPEMVAELEIEIMSLTYSIEGKNYKDCPVRQGMSDREFYNKLREGVPCTTAQLNPSDVSAVFEETLKEGKDILYIAFSSALSGTYQSASMAAAELKKQYPNNKVIVVDSLAASMGEGLLVYMAVAKKREGYTIEELEKWVYEHRNKIAHWFTVDDLHHLKRGGRVSATAAIIGSALGIKPILHVDNEGRLIPQKKVRGRKQSLISLVNKMEETLYANVEQPVFISHGDSKEDAQFVAERIREKYPKVHISINYVGPVIGSHSGPGTIALFFLATGK